MTNNFNFIFFQFDKKYSGLLMFNNDQHIIALDDAGYFDGGYWKFWKKNCVEFLKTTNILFQSYNSYKMMMDDKFVRNFR